MIQSPKKILIVPLDWGLGHATRCIPIIRKLLEIGAEVHVGGTHTTNRIIQQEFENLQYHDFPSYGISYTEKKQFFILHMMFQMPGMALRIIQEKRITRRLVDQYQFDIIISDNRFGVQDFRSKNIFMSHQLNIQIPGANLIAGITNWLNRYFIHRYQLLLIPDWPTHFLSGNLSKSKKLNIAKQFLGPLSRWRLGASSNIAVDGVLIILSGPEPQRTALEKLVVRQAKAYRINITIVRAKPMEPNIPEDDYVRYFNHLSSEELKQLVLKSEVVISRAGYSSIMDFVALKKHAILIPTPGQTEQEYLAKHLGSTTLFHFYDQELFDLQIVKSKYENAVFGKFPEISDELLELVLKQYF